MVAFDWLGSGYLIQFKAKIVSSLKPGIVGSPQSIDGKELFLLLSHLQPALTLVLTPCE
jgi:hypothetical protein